MKKSIKVDQKRARGRPATGRDPMVSSRIPAEIVSAVDDWAGKNETTRSDAIRQLVEIGLTVKSRPKQTSRARADMAHAMAGDQLDRHADGSASTEEQASRKRHLLSGPEEFQNVRIDRPAKKR